MAGKIGRHVCGTWLEFVGITPQAPHNRWDFCPICKMFWVTCANGAVLNTVVPPPDGLFRPIPEIRAEEPSRNKTVTRRSAPGCGIGAY